MQPDKDETPALAIARAVVARGWRPFPVEYRGKRPAVGIKWGTATASVPTEKTLQWWFGRDPVNVGIAARGSGLVILDQDNADGMERLCAAYGRAAEIPQTYQVDTGKGRHWYFRAPAGVYLSNKPGMLAEFGFDVRGGSGADGKGEGGYVVAAGSVHESGRVYRALDPDAEVAELPDWLVQLLLAKPEEVERAPEAGRHSADEYRPYTEEQADAWVAKYAIGPLRSAPEGGRNNALNTAALVFGHFVPEFWPEQEVVEGLIGIAEQLGLETKEIEPTIRSGLRAGLADWTATKVERSDPFASGSEPSAGVDPYEKAVAQKLHDLRVTEEARRRLARERRAHRPRIADGVIDDLDSITEPDFLMASLIPEASVGFLAGRSGAYKSFLATAWACCIATGRPWLGRPEFAVRRGVKTLYVAAEGSAGAAGRIRAWEAATEVSRRGKLLLYDRAIHLNDPAQVEELTEFIVEHEIGFLVIDTYHRSAPGTEENSSTDFGMVFEAVATLRDEHGCSTLFVDHTGGAKNGNPRGTSAKRDDADYVLSTSYPGEEAAPGAQRELFVTKLKDAPSEGRWGIRLEHVPEQSFPIAVIGLVAGPDVAAALGEWYLPENCPQFSRETSEMIDHAANEQRGRGREAARWVWRLLSAIDDETGLTLAEIKRMLKAAPPSERFSEEIVKRGVTVLKKAGLVWQDGARYGLESINGSPV